MVITITGCTSKYNREYDDNYNKYSCDNIYSVKEDECGHNLICFKDKFIIQKYYYDYDSDKVCEYYYMDKQPNGTLIENDERIKELDNIFMEYNEELNVFIGYDFLNCELIIFDSNFNVEKNKIRCRY